MMTSSSGTSSSYGYARLANDRHHKINESRRVKILIGVVGALLVVLYLQRKHHNEFLTEGDRAFIDQYMADSHLNRIYAITPTYARPVQKPELTRISHVVKLCPQIHWIIVEDATQQTKLVRDLIYKAGLADRTTILNEPTPTVHKQKIPNYQQPRGVSQRNLALKWVREHVDPEQYHQSVVFFMDDDNTYTVELFREMSKIQPGRVGVWPVGLVGGMMVEKPILDPKTDVVVGFSAMWRPERPFPVDMAGFAVSVDLLIANPDAKFSYDVERGYQETEILRHVTTMEKLQPLANRCRSIYVWHTRTEPPKFAKGVKMDLLDEEIE